MANVTSSIKLSVSRHIEDCAFILLPCSSIFTGKSQHDLLPNKSEEDSHIIMALKKKASQVKPTSFKLWLITTVSTFSIMAVKQMEKLRVLESLCFNFRPLILADEVQQMLPSWSYVHLGNSNRFYS